MKGEQRSGWSPVRYLEKECRPQEGGHTLCYIGKQIGTEHEGDT